jgi:hypothetical protein
MKRWVRAASGIVDSCLRALKTEAARQEPVDREALTA